MMEKLELNRFNNKYKFLLSKKAAYFTNFLSFQKQLEKPLFKGHLELQNGI
jgi:hypothetical protein